jgi:type I restriction enzyme S subunit
VSTNIPAGWAWASFSQVARIAANLVDPLKWPHLPHIAPDNIERDTGRLLSYRTIQEDRVTSAKHRFYPGQLLYSKIRPYLNKCIRVDFEGLCSADMYPVDAFIAERFLHYFMLTRQFVSAVSSAAGSRTILPKTNQVQMAALPVPVAPLPEQHRIVDALDSYLTRLDDAVASLERAQAKLKAYRASVLKAAVEGRLVPTEAALARAEKRDYEPAEVLLARILKERRLRWEEAELARIRSAGKTPKDDNWKTKYEEPFSPDTSELREIPEGWCWASVEQLAANDASALCDGPFGSNLKTEHYTDSGPRVVRLQNIGEGVFFDENAHISKAHFDKLRKHEVFAGDLLVASLGAELPRACQVPMWLGPAIVKADCLRFAVNPEVADPKYVMHALNSQPTKARTESLVHGVGRPRLGLGLFRTTALPLPPRAEQERIASLLDQILSDASAVQNDAVMSASRSNRLRQSILKWAFEGRLVDQDPRDEPAEKLLSRIRSEGAAAPAKKPNGRRRGAA